MTGPGSSVVGPAGAGLGLLIAGIATASTVGHVIAVGAALVALVVVLVWMWVRVRRHLAQQQQVLNDMVAEIREPTTPRRWGSVRTGDTIDGWLVEHIELPIGVVGELPTVVLVRGSARRQLTVHPDTEARIPPAPPAPRRPTS